MKDIKMKDIFSVQDYVRYGIYVVLIISVGLWQGLIFGIIFTFIFFESESSIIWNRMLLKRMGDLTTLLLLLGDILMRMNKSNDEDEE